MIICQLTGTGYILIIYPADPLNSEDIAEDGVPHDGVAELERLLLLLIEHDQAVHLDQLQVSIKVSTNQRPVLPGG